MLIRNTVVDFINKEHEEFFLEMLDRTGCIGDVYHEAFFYAMGLTHETQQNIEQLYDFKQRCISFAGLRQGWQTSTSRRICNLAFNLFNGFNGSKLKEASAFTPDELFCCGLQRYMFEAIKLRYPEYYH